MTKEQWQAIKNKDASHDGEFFYVTRQSGCICRPSCTRKTQPPKSIIIFNTLEEALAAGYRPCKRCRPDTPGWKGAKRGLAEAAQEYIENNYKDDFSLDRLADSLHVNKFYLLRTFEEVTGQTPLKFHNSLRCRKAREMLQSPELSMSYIASETGFNSASHFSRVFKNVTGMTPSRYRKEYLESLDS